MIVEKVSMATAGGEAFLFAVIFDETDAAGADWLGNEESSITTRYG